jgi:hypothetical protein
VSTLSATAAPQAVFVGESRMERLAGIGGLVFLVLLVVQNLLKATTGPANSATAAQIVHFARSEAWTVNLLVVTYVLGFPCLFLFASGLSLRCSELAPASEIWSRLGRYSVCVIAVLFGLVNIVQVVIVAARKELAADPALALTLWALHNAIFTINLLAIGGALLGLGRAAALAGLIPRWLGKLTIVGAALLAFSAAPAVAEVHGSKILALGLVGFICWLMLLGIAGVRLMRTSADPAARA